MAPRSRPRNNCDWSELFLLKAKSLWFLVTPFVVFMVFHISALRGAHMEMVSSIAASSGEKNPVPLLSPKSIPAAEENRRNEGSESLSLREEAEGRSLENPSNGTLGRSAADYADESKSATVMGLASGYPLSAYKRFVGSLRSTGYEGHILLGVAPDVPDDVLEYLDSMHVTVKILEWVKCTYQGANEDNDGKDIFSKTTCAHPFPDIKIRWSRYPLGRQWLLDCETCTGPVLITDVRDTFFQQNPFAPPVQVQGLQVFEEHVNMTTTNWLVEWPLRECKQLRIEKPMLCSGTTVGTRDAMLEYLGIMYEEMKEWISDPICRFDINGDDQTIHNYLYYTGKLPFAKAIPNREGIVHTVGFEAAQRRRDFKVFSITHHLALRGESGANKDNLQPVEEWIPFDFGLTDEKGYLTNFDGSRSRVVHQYDRFGNDFTRAWLDRQPYAKEEE